MNYYEDSKKIFELAETIYPLYVKADLKQKAGIARILTSNCLVNDATLYPTMRKPFNYIAEGLLCSNWLPREGSLPFSRPAIAGLLSGQTFGLRPQFSPSLKKVL